jgi:hypothetical protein
MLAHEPRTWSDFFTEDYQPYLHAMRFREWKVQVLWPPQLKAYDLLGWKYIPIAVRGKSPIRAAHNYRSHSIYGPYLTQQEALRWVGHDFNLAVCPAPSGILWLDMDDPNLAFEWMLSGPLMVTPRGFAAPLKADRTMTKAKTKKLTQLHYDLKNKRYELVAYSATCVHDSAQDLKRRPHPPPSKPCVDQQKHDFRIREWVSPLSNRPVTFCELYRQVVKR